MYISENVVSCSIRRDNYLKKCILLKIQKGEGGDGGLWCQNGWMTEGSQQLCLLVIVIFGLAGKGWGS